LGFSPAHPAGTERRHDRLSSRFKRRFAKPIRADIHTAKFFLASIRPQLPPAAAVFRAFFSLAVANHLRRCKLRLARFDVSQSE
jgi:hypothetical protein